MDLKRLAQHLMTTRRRVERAFPAQCLAAIDSAIATSESSHSGEIRFVVEGALDGMPLLHDQSARERALDLFSQLRVWDTEHNNGVLIYLLLADRDVEIVADRGIHAKVGAHAWETICREMEAAFKRGEYERGVSGGIRTVTRHLIAHFPAAGGGSNELPDQAVVL